jgi:hypothetical protein
MYLPPFVPGLTGDPDTQCIRFSFLHFAGEKESWVPGRNLQYRCVLIYKIRAKRVTVKSCSVTGIA